MNRLPFRGVTLIEDARLHLSLIINFGVQSLFVMLSIGYRIR